ncbi:MAG: ATP-binding cassette domain-containing protein [Clostridia bacterium]|nr:ATP-binding cassette domain-containing protein [Clostridia bacterium]
MIELKNVTKTFKVAKRTAGFGQALKSLFSRDYTYVQALNDVSFTVNGGEMVGYIGPNGAGKSSTVKIMSGILTPDSGECIINGRTPWKDRVEHVRNIGVVFGQRSQLWWDVPVIDSFELIRDIYKVDKAEYKKTLSTLTELLNLGEILKTPARQLSLGQRMRCEIAASLLHNPKILFLDEPTIGLDASSKIAVREFIKSINKENKTTVILTTHDMQDIEALTERILLIGKGRILLDGTLEELKKRHSSLKTLTVDYTGACLPLCENYKVVKDGNGRGEILIDTGVITASQAISFISDHVEIKDISVTGETIDETVVSLYKEFAI